MRFTSRANSSSWSRTPASSRTGSSCSSIESRAAARSPDWTGLSCPMLRSHDRFDEIEWAERLGEERIGAGAESLVARARRVLRSEYDDASGTERRIGAQRAAHLIPIQTGHHHIKDDDVGRPDRGDRERVLSVHRFVEVEA